MDIFTKTVSAEVGQFDELALDEQNLILQAMQARLRAQAPYSNYWVGAAVETNDGILAIGCNVERVSYSQTTHAEQNAIDSLVAANGPIKISAIAFVAAPGTHKIITRPSEECIIKNIKDIPVPCGHCLQIIWENCDGDPNVKLLAMTPSGYVIRTTIGDAFPMRFGPEALNK